MRNTQNRKVLHALMRYGTISSSFICYTMRIMRPGARIWDLKRGKLGGVFYRIKTIHDKKRRTVFYEIDGRHRATWFGKAVTR